MNPTARRATDDATTAVIEMVERETAAWNRKDADALVGLFHPDMVWPWPPTPQDHDPMTWIMPMGRFDARRWRAMWQELFDTHELAVNERTIRRVEVTPEGDGGLAVVDINTVWRRLTDDADDAWRGRVCKVYARCRDGWKLTMHTGVLSYRPPALSSPLPADFVRYYPRSTRSDRPTGSVRSVTRSAAPAIR